MVNYIWLATSAEIFVQVFLLFKSLIYFVIRCQLYYCQILVLCMFCIKILYLMASFRYFLPHLWLFASLKYNPSQIRFILDESSILILSFMDCDFDVVSKKLSPNPNSFRFSLIFFSRNYVVLNFIFRSMTIVCYLFWRMKSLCLNVLHMVVQLLLNLLLKSLFAPFLSLWQKPWPKATQRRLYFILNFQVTAHH